MKHALLALSFAWLACKSEPPAPPKFDPVSRDEAEALGRRFAELIGPCDPRALAPLWKAEVTARRAALDAKASAEVKQGLLAAFTSERLWDGQCQSMNAGSPTKAKYLGLREASGSFHPIVRLVSAAGLNYVELELGRFPEGVFAVDATYYLTGELLSRTLARLMGSAQSALDDGDLGDGRTMMRISELQRSGDAAGALALIRELPPALRQDKSLMLLEIGLDPGDDEARYLAAIERFERAFPGDPALDLVSVDGFFMRKQYDRLHTALDRLDQRVKDPYLDVMRALAHFDASASPDATGRDPKALDEAHVSVKRAIEREPDMQDAWDTQSTICLARKDHACAVAALKVLAERFALPIDDATVLGLEGGADLVASDPWKTWRASLH